jgi:hypothetical protein
MKVVVHAALAVSLFVAGATLVRSADDRASEERLRFQTSGPWSPRTNLNADVAINRKARNITGTRPKGCRPGEIAMEGNECPGAPARPIRSRRWAD